MRKLEWTFVILSNDLMAVVNACAASSLVGGAVPTFDLSNLGMPTLGFGLGPIGFDRPAWWLLAPVVIGLILLIGRKTLTGEGTNVRRVAMAIRIVLSLLLIGVLAEPQYRRQAKNVSVVMVTDASRSAPSERMNQINQAVGQWQQDAKPEHLLGVVTAARNAAVQVIPRRVSTFANQDVGATDATDLAGGVRAAMSIMPPDASNRILLVSDGNETAGDLLAAARAAEAAKVPIDVLPIQYVIDREVLVDRLSAPANARPGETANLRVVLTATKPTTGRLSILKNGQPIDLDPTSDELSARVDLASGTNVQTVPVRTSQSGVDTWEAIFEPIAIEGQPKGDTVVENNRAVAVTFVGGKGRVMVLTSRLEEASQLVEAIRDGAREVVVREPTTAWNKLAELGSYEAVVMVNCSASEFSQQQQEDLRNYVHELGGGLVMVGGDQSFGAGGWIGSPLADALPIKLDPPQKRQMPRGALVLVMHSCEMPSGNYWGRRSAEAAINALSAQDLVGVIEYSWQGGDGWVHPLSVVGNKQGALRALGGLTFGDAPSFDTMLTSTLAALRGVQAGQKHTIIISDGDPQGPSQSILDDFVKNKISISCVAVFPHSWGNASNDLTKMRRIAKFTGGTYHEITDQVGNINSIPEIFIKEAQTIKRSLIWEGEPFRPRIEALTEGLRGINSVPAVTGYIVASDREGLSQVVLRGQESDPVLAQWQHGLGRVVTFTGDASSKWSAAWVSWAQFRQFWDQHVKWAMRPTGNVNMRVVTSDQGDQTRLIVEAANDQGDRLDFLRFRSRALGPDGTGKPFDLVQTGPGRYEATIETGQAGAYVLNMGYEDPNAQASAARGAIQVAVTRPFLDEFRALRDNLPLLEQVAARTGGRVLAGVPTAKELWDPTGLDRPVSLRPIWMLALIIVLGVFLTDVAVRRVRIDVPAIALWVRGLFGVSTSAATGRADELAAARARAREKMEAKAAGGGVVGQSIRADGSAVGDASAAKFEPTAEEIAAIRKRGDRIMEQWSTQSGPAAPISESGSNAAKDNAADSGAGGLDRLRKAKRRAQDEMQD